MTELYNCLYSIAVSENYLKILITECIAESKQTHLLEYAGIQHKLLSSWTTETPCPHSLDIVTESHQYSAPKTHNNARLPEMTK